MRCKARSQRHCHSERGEAGIIIFGTTAMLTCPQTRTTTIPSQPIPAHPVSTPIEFGKRCTLPVASLLCKRMGERGYMCPGCISSPLSVSPGLPAAPVACRTISEHGLLWLPRAHDPLIPPESPFPDPRKPTGSPWESSLGWQFPFAFAFRIEIYKYVHGFWGGRQITF